jgi:hypothetical protein
VVTRHWVEHGFGTPSAIYLLYVLKMAVYVAGGARAPTGALLGQVSSTSLSRKQNRLIRPATGTRPQAKGSCGPLGATRSTQAGHGDEIVEA